MKFTFMTNKFERVMNTHVYKIFTLESIGDTLEQAYEAIESQIPDGFKVWTWYSDADDIDIPLE